LIISGKIRQKDIQSLVGLSGETVRDIIKIIRDYYFWLIIALVAGIGFLIYVPDIFAPGWLPSYEEFELNYLAIERPLFLITVAVAAWRFEMKGGLAAFLAIILIAVPHSVTDFIEGEEQLLFLLDLGATAVVGLGLIWLIGRHRRREDLLERALAEVGGIRDQLEVRVKERTAELAGANERLDEELTRRKKLIARLEEAMADVKKLSGLLPICASCKKIRDDKGSWQVLESYIADHSEADFSHGICPDCIKKLYPEVAGET
jgi:hypothetical protein